MPNRIESDSIRQQTAGASGGFSASGWDRETLATLEGLDPVALADLSASLSAESTSKRRAPNRRAGHPRNSPYAISVASRHDPLNTPPGASAPAHVSTPTLTAPIAATASSARQENHMQSQSLSKGSPTLSSESEFDVIKEFDAFNNLGSQTNSPAPMDEAGDESPPFGLGPLPEVGGGDADNSPFDEAEAITLAETIGANESDAIAETPMPPSAADDFDAPSAAHEYSLHPDELSADAAQIASEHAFAAATLPLAHVADAPQNSAAFSARELPLLPPVQRPAARKLADVLKALPSANGGAQTAELSMLREGEDHTRRVNELIQKAARLTENKDGFSSDEAFNALQELAGLLPSSGVNGATSPEFWKLVLRDKVSARQDDPMFDWIALMGVNAALSKESVKSTISAGRQAGAVVFEAVLNAGQGLLDALGDQQFEGLEAIRSQFNRLLGGLNELRFGIARASENATGASKQLVESAAAARETCEQISREIEAIVDNAGLRLKTSFDAEIQTAVAEMRAEISTAAAAMETLRNIAADVIRKDATDLASDFATRAVKHEKALTDIDAAMDAKFNATRNKLLREAEAAGKAVRAEGDRAARKQVNAVDEALQAAVQKATDRISGSAVAATEMVANRVGEIAAAAIAKANKRNTLLLYAACGMSFVAFVFELGSRVHF